ncbi:hypothetical protein EXIGLDRAFT_834467 [Exidia glandulosa HHB12029]|uniref:F-box domain-containing protein n=1 Tax=Exidia glandulosa HHB12029 TaxID=1314781 RepID=A0A165JQW4_EXIGL|nr:hypothetical protein EXIGLDRAFT_834467 [Exidia glandulosa HHB12029]
MVPEASCVDLTQAVQRVFRDARQSAGLRDETLEAGDWLQIAAEVRACFESAVAAELQEHNAERMRSLRLPDELWAEVWSHLPMRSVVSVSHVCHMWRLLALASPPLWAVLEVFDHRHGAVCHCQSCWAVSLGAIYCKGCRSRALAIGNTSTELARLLLPRSNSSPLSLTLHIDRNEAEDETQTIAELLAPHHQRIVHINWRSGRKHKSTAGFLRHFDALPALRTLSSINTIVEFSRKIHLPSLRQLQVLGTPYTAGYDFSTGRLEFPSVTRLGYTMPIAWRDYLSSTLATVPNLQTLDVYGSPLFEDPVDVDYRDVTKLAAGIEDVQIDCVSKNMYRIAMALYTPQRRTFAVELADAPSSGFHHIFGDLRDDIQLSVVRERNIPTHQYSYLYDTSSKYINLDGVDSHGRRRRISQHPEEDGIEAVWDHLSPPTLSALRIDVTLIPVVIGTVSEYPALHELTLNVDSLAVTSVPCFPALRVLRATVAADTQDLAPSIPAEFLASFIVKARIEGGVLAELVLENIKLGGDLDALRPLVRRGVPD